MMSTPVEEESVTTLDVYTGCGSLGVSIVGGVDTPLVYRPLAPYYILLRSL